MCVASTAADYWCSGRLFEGDRETSKQVLKGIGFSYLSGMAGLAGRLKPATNRVNCQYRLIEPGDAQIAAQIQGTSYLPGPFAAGLAMRFR